MRPQDRDGEGGGLDDRPLSSGPPFNLLQGSPRQKLSANLGRCPVSFDPLSRMGMRR